MPARSLLVVLAALLLGGASDHVPAAAPLAPAAGAAGHVYGAWAPSRPGECSKLIHDRYAELGPDGKLRPAWHPPVDPSGCSFGHDHGPAPVRGGAYRVALRNPGDLPQEEDRPR